jgi:hypothetical protein
VAGYSGTPLAKKLGIVADTRLHLIGAPTAFAHSLAPLPEGVRLITRLTAGVDLVIWFTTEQRDLKAKWDKVTASMQPAGGIWVAWPKKASKAPTDITENVLREVLLPTGWVDTKVCAIDDTWSGLKFVLRKELRPKLK